MLPQAGGAPNGGGNIDNKNMVTILEGLKLVRKNTFLSHFEMLKPFNLPRRLGTNIDRTSCKKMRFPQAMPETTVTWSVGTGINGYDGPIHGPHASQQQAQQPQVRDRPLFNCCSSFTMKAKGSLAKTGSGHTHNTRKC